MVNRKNEFAHLPSDDQLKHELGPQLKADLNDEEIMLRNVDDKEDLQISNDKMN